MDASPFQSLPDELISLVCSHLLPLSPSSTYPPTSPKGSTSHVRRYQWNTPCPKPSWAESTIELFLTNVKSSALYSLALVSKRLHALVNPYLYMTINLQSITATICLACTLEGHYDGACVGKPYARSLALGRMIRHLHLPNDGLLHGVWDRLAGMDDTALFAPSLRAILQRSPRIQSIAAITRPTSVILRQVLNVFGTNGDNSRPFPIKRMTINCLSFTHPLLEGRMNTQHLTHLHLIQWIPTSLSNRFGPELFSTLQVLRLSRIPRLTLEHVLSIVKDSNKANMNRDEFIRFLVSAPSHQYHRARDFLQLLMECIQKCDGLEKILLEVEQMPDLDRPEGLLDADNALELGTSPYAMSAGGLGAPFDQFSSGEPLGTLASLDYPADIPLSPEESDEWAAARQVHSHYAPRDEYWASLRSVQQMLIRFSRHSRPHGDVDVRIVAPRLLGWDGRESYVDFAANVHACRASDNSPSSHTDTSAFADRDVFDLVKEDPYMGYEWGVNTHGKRIPYWTGAVPRYATCGKEPPELPWAV